jgi:ubiquinone/menaquinone biosynthesis C-methylase UbiE
MPSVSEEKYTLGYSTSSLDWMTSRTADGHGAFFLDLLEPHMNLLDCGCGPGTLTIGFAERLKYGTAIGIDRETDQTGPVRAVASERGLDNLEFVEGDIYVLPYPDDHFDAVFASAVLGSIGNAENAVTEMVRVLKPGGVIGLKEFDHGADIIWPLNPVLEQSIELYHRLRAVNGHEQMAGRKLRGYLSGHGLEVEHLAAYFDQQTDTETLITYVERNNGLFYEVLGPQFIEHGWCTAEDIDTQVAAWREFARDPAAIYISAWLEAVGRKPA